MTPRVALLLPEDWAFIPADGGTPDLDALLAPLASHREALEAVRRYLEAVVESLRGSGIIALASFYRVDDSPLSLVQASCAIAAHPLEPGADDPYAALASASPFDAAERELTGFEGAAGSGARSVAFRAATELIDEVGAWPYVLEVRYAVPFADGVAAVVHFESLTPVYWAELVDLFDAIARTVRAGG